MKKRAKKYEPELTLKEEIQFTDLIGLSLRTPPDKPAKKKAKKKGQ